MIRGFTLVEMLLATALGAVLLAGSLGVVSSLTAPSRARAQDDRTISDAVVELIRFDLLHARTIDLDGDTVVLTGYGSLARDIGVGAHEPVKVEYHVSTRNNRSWLVRTQTQLNEATNHNRWAELVCAGVKRIRIEPDDSTRVVSETGDGVPARVRLVIEGDGQDGINVERVLVLH